MQPAPPTPDEADRIAMLHALAILDSPAEAIFDRITRLVARVLDVPIALVSLIDTDRQWFKSKFGLDATETPREYAFCAHAILQTSPFVIPDASKDERFSTNPLVTSSPNIRFYAGVPIRTTAGFALGTLCAIDERPRTLTKDQLDILIDLADLVSKEIQLRETLVLTRSQLKVTQEVLQASEARFRTVFEKAAVGIAMVAPDGGWLNVNEDLCRIVGYTKDELANMTFQDITHPDDLNADLGALGQLVRDEIDRYEMEKRYIHKNGEIVWINLSVVKHVNISGDLNYFVSIITDINARKVAEQALEKLTHELEERVVERTKDLSKSNEMLSVAMAERVKSDQELRKRELELRMVIENANDAYICIDQAGFVSAWNRQAEETFGWSADEAIGKKLDELIIPQQMHHAHQDGMHHYLQTGEAKVLNKRVELPAICRDGRKIPVEVRITALEIDGQTIFSAFLHDISARKEAEAKREWEALNDSLTGLSNRRALTHNLPVAMARTDRSGHAMALLFIDLDGFKQINDTLGHDAGDALLREVAKRMTGAVRQTDSVIRMAGDEFVLLLESVNNSAVDARLVAEKILQLLCNPVAIGTDTAHISASIGIAVYQPKSGISAEDLLKFADTAMYEAKRAGKKQIVLSSLRLN